VLGRLGIELFGRILSGGRPPGSGWDVVFLVFGEVGTQKRFQIVALSGTSRSAASF
jgi:hypothetical protein